MRIPSPIAVVSEQNSGFEKKNVTLMLEEDQSQGDLSYSDPRINL